MSQRLARLDGWSTRHIVLHDRAKDRGLDVLPLDVAFGHGDKVGP
jgi:hypothetical protein